MIKITIKCAGCGKDKHMDQSHYKSLKAEGRFNFYHKECVKINRKFGAWGWK